MRRYLAVLVLVLLIHLYYLYTGDRIIRIMVLDRWGPDGLCGENCWRYFENCLFAIRVLFDFLSVIWLSQSSNMSHTALVNVDASAACKLATFIGELTGDSDAKTAFVSQCEGLQSQPVEMLLALLSKTDLILALENEKGNIWLSQEWVFKLSE